MPQVQVRYYASARAAAGVESESLSLPAGSSLNDLIAVLGERHPQQLPRVLTAASFLLDGVAAKRRETPLPDQVQLDVLPPFAGG
jgi:molybdopterin synthase sulfur carrier subunit